MKAANYGSGEIGVVQPVHYFGCCPVCHSQGILYHVGREEYIVCEEHLIAWHIGSNLFSCWHEMTDAEFEANAIFLSRCRIIEPPPCTCEPGPDLDLEVWGELGDLL